MDVIERIIEKNDSHITPYKPKPLCSCFIGDMMVDTYPRLDFDKKYTNQSRIFIGHTHEKISFDNINVYNGNNEEINETIDVISEYLRYHRLLLH